MACYAVQAVLVLLCGSLLVADALKIMPDIPGTLTFDVLFHKERTKELSSQ